MNQKRIFTIPNLLSLYRLILSVIIPILWIKDIPHDTLALLIVSGVLSDTLDGNLARILKQKSNLGRILDPLADKAFINMLFLLFYLEKVIELSLLAIVLLRDLLILIGSLYLLKRGIDSSNLRPTPLGKTSTVVQLITLVILFIDLYLKDVPDSITLSFQYLTIFFTSASGFQYFLVFLRYNYFSGISKVN